ncbi:hypothetical protein MNBD_GAMMA22-225 [hydrothermal vent metagenome]|uniref:CAAX prenyl protease 2/Lysostaphin resistance protein A-like domain-containing protein n=1 Tax=hydrothermal vent metagenome TaxID=652676 RepID=A0A3B0ZZ66_9ZZZZ
MIDTFSIILYLVFATSFILVWGKMLWYLDERSNALRSWVLLIMSFVGSDMQAVKTVLLSVLYYTCGLIGCVIFALFFTINFSVFFSFSWQSLALTLIGIIAEVSLANLLISLYLAFARNKSPERFKELSSIPWIAGLKNVPSSITVLLAASAGAVEELFFRGILLYVMLYNFLLTPILAVVIVTLLFLAQQLIQLKTVFQCIVIASGCISISIVGGLLLIYTQSIIPAIICHVFFVVFFMRNSAAE